VEINDTITAVGLFSGGLDSILAHRLLMEQGIDVIALHFTSLFLNPWSRRGKGDGEDQYARYIEVIQKDCAGKITLKNRDLSPGYLEMLHNPARDYGRQVNPCIDCHIHMLKAAREEMDIAGAKFIFTGEVVGQRPMSQQMRELNYIARESGLRDLLLRPLSAKHLVMTRPEREGWVDRERLMNITGRGRKPQIEYARSIGLTDFPNPAGGCILTEVSYGDKVKDMWKHGDKQAMTWNDYELLQTGRHLRVSESLKLIVGRDEAENNLLEKHRQDRIMLEVDDIPGPIVLIDAVPEDVTDEMLEIAASVTGRYSDGDQETELPIRIVMPNQEFFTKAKPLSSKEVSKWIIS